MITLRPSAKAVMWIALATGLGFSMACHAQVGPDLQRAVLSSNWNQINQAYRTTPTQTSIPVLRKMANENYVIAQWLLADALALQGQDAEATTWLYMASLGTRMDASLCRNKNSTLIEYRFLDAFRPQFDRIRVHPQNRYNALMQSVAFHKGRLRQSADPTWVCSMVAQETKRPSKNLTVSSEAWPNNRQRILVEYQKQTGLDFSRTPDLFEMTPVKGR